MEFRKMVMITLYARQQKRHRCIEQSFGLCGRGRGWDDLREWHWNLYNILCEMNRQSRLAAWYRMLTFGALGWPRGMVWREVAAGFRMRNACTPVADSCWCVAKPIQYCKVISIQLNKFILKKKKRNEENPGPECRFTDNHCQRAARAPGDTSPLTDSSLDFYAIFTMETSKEKWRRNENLA